MKPRVALFLVASVILLGSIAAAQTRRTGASKSAPGKARNETTKICQGVPIPDGYVIVGYLTASACPHGEYIIKKQDSYESSLGVNRNERQSVGGAAQPGGTSAQPARTSSPIGVPARAAGASPQTTGMSSQPKGGSGGAGRASASGSSRPRRVGTAQSDDEVSSAIGTTQSPSDASSAGTTESQNEAPTLIGAAPRQPLRPPTLAGATAGGTPVNPVGAPVSASPDAVAATGPEEVSEGDVVRVDTTLVTVPVSVLDRQGRFVPNLRREDFSIFENGVEQKISYFEPAEKPFTVALLLDTSPSTHFHLSEIKEAAIAFAKQLRPQDRVLIVSFNDQVLLLTEVTNDQNIIDTVIEENANTGTATRLYDAVDLVIKERLNKIKGRKAVVLFTDGVDTASYMATYKSTLREVEELDALIYPIQYDTTDYLRAMQNAGSGTVTIVTRTSSWPFGTTTSQTTQTVPLNGGLPLPGATKADYDRADQYLRELADKTGGRLYQANDTAQLSQAFTRIAEELRRQYSLGYYPQTAAVENGERRQIRVRVHQADLAVKARDSYMRTSPASPPQ